MLHLWSTVNCPRRCFLKHVCVETKWWKARTSSIHPHEITPCTRTFIMLDLWSTLNCQSGYALKASWKRVCVETKFEKRHESSSIHPHEVTSCPRTFIMLDLWNCPIRRCFEGFLKACLCRNRMMRRGTNQLNPPSWSHIMHQKSRSLEWIPTCGLDQIRTMRASSHDFVSTQTLQEDPQSIELTAVFKHWSQIRIMLWKYV